MVYSFQAETILYTLAAIGLAVILREGWLWLLRRPGKAGDIPAVLSVAPPPDAAGMKYIHNACDEIRCRYFPGLLVCMDAGTQETRHVKPTHQN